MLLKTLLLFSLVLLASAKFCANEASPYEIKLYGKCGNFSLGITGDTVPLGTECGWIIDTGVTTPGAQVHVYCPNDGIHNIFDDSFIFPVPFLNDPYWYQASEPFIDAESADMSYGVSQNLQNGKFQIFHLTSSSNYQRHDLKTSDILCYWKVLDYAEPFTPQNVQECYSESHTLPPPPVTTGNVRADYYCFQDVDYTNYQFDHDYVVNNFYNFQDGDYYLNYFGRPHATVSLDVPNLDVWCSPYDHRSQTVNKYFLATYTAHFNVPYKSQYKFHMRANQAAIMFINGYKAFDSFNGQFNDYTITLYPGTTVLTIFYKASTVPVLDLLVQNGPYGIPRQFTPDDFADWTQAPPTDGCLLNNAWNGCAHCLSPFEASIYNSWYSQPNQESNYMRYNITANHNHKYNFDTRDPFCVKDHRAFEGVDQDIPDPTGHWQNFPIDFHYNRVSFTRSYNIPTGSTLQFYFKDWNPQHDNYIMLTTDAVSDPIYFTIENDTLPQSFYLFTPGSGAKLTYYMISDFSSRYINQYNYVHILYRIVYPGSNNCDFEDMFGACVQCATGYVNTVDGCVDTTNTCDTGCTYCKSTDSSYCYKCNEGYYLASDKYDEADYTTTCINELNIFRYNGGQYHDPSTGFPSYDRGVTFDQFPTKPVDVKTKFTTLKAAGKTWHLEKLENTFRYGMDTVFEEIIWPQRFMGDLSDISTFRFELSYNGAYFYLNKFDDIDTVINSFYKGELFKNADVFIPGIYEVGFYNHDLVMHFKTYFSETQYVDAYFRITNNLFFEIQIDSLLSLIPEAVQLKYSEFTFDYDATTFSTVVYNNYPYYIAEFNQDRHCKPQYADFDPSYDDNLICQDCIDGYVLDPDNPGFCIMCKDTYNCKNCDGNSLGCTQCYNNAYFNASSGEWDNACMDCVETTSCEVCTIFSNILIGCSCSSGYYLSDFSECSECDSSCTECNGVTGGCTLCDNMYYFSGTSGNVGTTCLETDTSCKEFNVNTGGCTDCYDGYGFKGEIGESGTICEPCNVNFTFCAQCNAETQGCLTCPVGYGLNGTSGEIGANCVMCPEELNCKHCFVEKEAFYCTECENDLYFSFETAEEGRACIDPTTSPYNCAEFASNLPYEAHCTSCPMNYATTGLNYDFCYMCQPDFNCGDCNILESGGCTTCMDGYARNGTWDEWDNACLKCPIEFGCKTCNGQDDTLPCIDCPSGFALNGESGDTNTTCLPCTEVYNCETCNQDDYCSACPDGFGFDTDGYGTICTECLYPSWECKSCDISNGGCLTCYKGWSVNDTAGEAGTVCKECLVENNCVECDTETNGCTVCEADQFLSGDAGEENTKCLTCPSEYHCETCNDYDGLCKVCQDGYVAFSLFSGRYACLKETPYQSVSLIEHSGFDIRRNGNVSANIVDGDAETFFSLEDYNNGLMYAFFEVSPPQSFAKMKIYKSEECYNDYTSIDIYLAGTNYDNSELDINNGKLIHWVDMSIWSQGGEVLIDMPYIPSGGVGFLYMPLKYVWLITDGLDNCGINKVEFTTFSHCDDGVQNGDETGVDCGGSCQVTCGVVTPQCDPKICNNCFVYSDPPICTDCKEPYYKSSDLYVYGDYPKCLKCAQDDCKTCNTTSGGCLTCYDEYNLNGTAGVETTACVKCPLNCKECNHFDLTCSKCVDGYYAEDDTCLKCSKDNCVECNANTCTVCQAGFTVSARPEHYGHCIQTNNKYDNSDLTKQDGYIGAISNYKFSNAKNVQSWLIEPASKKSHIKLIFNSIYLRYLLDFIFVFDPQTLTNIDEFLVKPSIMQYTIADQPCCLELLVKTEDLIIIFAKHTSNSNFISNDYWWLLHWYATALPPPPPTPITLSETVDPAIMTASMEVTWTPTFTPDTECTFAGWDIIVYTDSVSSRPCTSAEYLDEATTSCQFTAPVGSVVQVAVAATCENVPAPAREYGFSDAYQTTVVPSDVPTDVYIVQPDHRITEFKVTWKAGDQTNHCEFQGWHVRDVNEHISALDYSLCDANNNENTLECNVKGLKREATYSFRVKKLCGMVNAQSDWSQPSNSVLMLKAADSPIWHNEQWGPPATATTMLLRWVPQISYDCEFVSWEVRYYLGPDELYHEVVTDFEDPNCITRRYDPVTQSLAVCKAINLESGVFYMFTVVEVCENTYTNSYPSEPSQIQITPSNPADPPYFLIPEDLVTTTTVELNLLPGESDNDCEFLCYNVLRYSPTLHYFVPVQGCECMDLNVREPGVNLTCTATGLEDNSYHNFKVQTGCTKVGTNSIWADLGIATKAYAENPKNVHLIPGRLSMIVSWEAPTLNDCDFVSYVIEWIKGNDAHVMVEITDVLDSDCLVNTTKESTIEGCNVTNPILPGVQYQARVMTLCENVYANSEWVESDIVTALAFGATPPVLEVTSIEAIEADFQITLATEYADCIYYCHEIFDQDSNIIDGCACADLPIDTLTCTGTGLTDGKEYNFTSQMKCSNPGADSYLSDNVRIWTEQYPGKPIMISQTLNEEDSHTIIDLEWLPGVASQDCTFSSWKITEKNDLPFTLPNSDDCLTDFEGAACNASTLTPGVRYEFYVQQLCVETYLFSEISDSIGNLATLYFQAYNPDNLQITNIINTAFDISWNENNRRECVNGVYVVRLYSFNMVEVTNFVGCDTIVGTSCSLSDLYDNTLYRFSVQLVCDNSLTSSDEILSLNSILTKQRADPVSILRVKDIMAMQMTLYWAAPTVYDCLFTQYNIYIMSEEDPRYNSYILYGSYTSLEVTVTSLLTGPGVTYTFFIELVCSNTWGVPSITYSNPINTLTPAYPVSAFTYDDLELTTVTLEWTPGTASPHCLFDHWEITASLNSGPYVYVTGCAPGSLNSRTINSCDVTGLQSGQPYDFTIIEYCSNYALGLNSELVRLPIRTYLASGAPQNVAVDYYTKTETNLELTWTQGTNNDCTCISEGDCKFVSWDIKYYNTMVPAPGCDELNGLTPYQAFSVNRCTIGPLASQPLPTDENGYSFTITRICSPAFLSSPISGESPKQRTVYKPDDQFASFAPKLTVTEYESYKDFNQITCYDDKGCPALLEWVTPDRKECEFTNWDVNRITSKPIHKTVFNSATECSLDTVSDPEPNECNVKVRGENIYSFEIQAICLNSWANSEVYTSNYVKIYSLDTLESLADEARKKAIAETGGIVGGVLGFALILAIITFCVYKSKNQAPGQPLPQSAQIEMQPTESTN